ncbi:DegT/DnrJ/EryC1/StrS aminotransferase family protein [Planococcus halocryophilus]|uniref:DegT/DnrJ/EryC1/StrS aminotransferase family protein n=1 Tax=Planococcus halocryophilus TaxID=1215089 RepID=A0A1C7DRK7_9BACL|nr:DegT/DnrJ/EryC1/StrS aminotransferase family protein [Planococcus halocryophilus]ANU13921.1 hypothetical protein BBI08_08680 [Planococcus halocryophilus]
MKEIGGYFGLEDLIHQEFYSDLLALNSGSNALLYLLKARQIKKIHIPYYLCDCISILLDKQGYEYEYYYVDSQFQPIFDKQLAQDEYLYVVNLYGQITEEKTRALKARYNQLILDHSQAFFQKPIEGIDTIYSCRKFFGVPDGAYLATDAVLSEKIEQDVSKDRMVHVLGRAEGKASDYYADFIAINDNLSVVPLRTMSKLTSNLMGAVDYERARQIRNENYAYLSEQFAAENPLLLTVPDGAFAYPLLVEDGPAIRKRLVQENIYIPLLWPNVLVDCPKTSIEYQYAANILPLPCDQRYTIEDMSYLVNALKSQLVYKE